MIAPLTAFAVALFAYSLLSRRLATSVVTMPMFFVIIGFATGAALGLFHVDPLDDRAVLLLEAALVAVLFADSSALDVRRWTTEPALSGRLLGIGLPLTMLVGSIAAVLVFPGLALWQAALIGVMLAPTDAALGQAVVSNPHVPAIVRNALNVEAGLNDGLVLPFVTILIAVGEVAAGAQSEIHAVETLIFVLTSATVVGLVVGIGGGWILARAADRGYAARRYHGIALIAIAFVAFEVADHGETSGFLAVWIAGLTAGAMVRDHVQEEAFELTEHAADIFAAASFAILGVGLIGPILSHATVQMFVYAGLSLTVVRLVPVAIAMVGTHFALPTLAYIGWFGPRGLASIVFAALVVQSAVPDAQLVTNVVLLTVTVSIVAHGITAAWGARRYTRWFQHAASANPEIAEAALPDSSGVQQRVSRIVR